MARIIGKGYSFDDVLILPKYNKVRSRKDVSFKTKVTKNYSIDIPFLAANMDSVCEAEMAIALGEMGGLGVLHRFVSIEEQVKMVKEVRAHHLLCAAAIGVKDLKERSAALAKAGVHIFVLDVAHGHSKYVGAAIAYLKEKYPRIDVMAGNIATKDAAEYLLAKGADAIKVGVGPGSMCTTRRMVGAGVPQITAIMDVYEATQGRVPICADGGIKIPGDVVKAIGAGADTVMCGSVISGTAECPGEIVNFNGRKYMTYRGSASYEATLKRYAMDGRKPNEVISVEGEKTYVEFKGSVKSIIQKFLGGLASGMTYMGSDNIEKVRGKADFVEITDMGLNESVAHGVKEI